MKINNKVKILLKMRFYYTSASLSNFLMAKNKICGDDIISSHQFIRS